MTDWLDELAGHDTAGNHVLVSIIHTQGSCPRDAGTRMLVSPGRNTGTIGGGHLEYRAIAIATELLAAGEPVFRIERFALGARLGQCCGGVAHVSFETIPTGLPAALPCGMSAALPDWVMQLAAVRHSGEQAVLVTPLGGLDPATGAHSIPDKLLVTSTTVTGTWPDALLQRNAEQSARAMIGETDAASDPGTVDWQPAFLCERVDAVALRLAVFGAGHVGKALVGTLAALPCHIDWIDSRRQEFPEHVPGNVTLLHSDDPEDEVPDLPPGSCVVIMTHSHAIDQRICESALRRDDLGWCGLIGSHTKRTLFKRRLSARGLGPDALSRLTCPIGVTGISGKHPAQIAIAVAAEILQSLEPGQATNALDREVACS